MQIQKKFSFVLISLYIVVASAAITFASNTDTISGYAWSDNIGWIKLNNCTTPGTPSTCETGEYGLTAATAASGTTPISGYAWSSNIGWIRFDDTLCPIAGCNAGARVNWTTGNIVGWARTCSVYASGCSGALADNAYRGGWDGYIALDSTSGGGSGYGVSFDKTTGAISGYGWGSDVIGWVSFTGNIKITPVPMCPDGVTPIPANNQCTCPAGKTYQIATNTCIDDIICTGGTIVNNQCICLTGTVLNAAGNGCVPIVCGPGTTLQGNNCVPTSCPKGQKLNPAGTECICNDGSAVPTTGQNAGQCPKKTPKYIEV